MSEKQFTIANSCTVTGTGVHTGKQVSMTFLPAPENTGYVFRRIDLEGRPEIPAIVENVTDISRGTTISVGKAKVLTVEHTLASLFGMGIDNVYIEMNGPEAPIMDGSALAITNALLEAGLTEQEAQSNYFRVLKPIHFCDEEKDVEFTFIPSEEFKITVLVDYTSPVIGYQHAELQNLANFASEIAPARTFSFLHEIESLLQSGLIKGGDLESALVVVDRVIDETEIERLATLFNKPKVEIKSTGFLSKSGLRFQNEPARHKLLDVIGDLALAGVRIKGELIARKPGHSSNIKLVKHLKPIIKKEQSIYFTPKYDLNATPLYDINQIKKVLAHRQPFLLIDKIVEMSDKHVVGVKSVSGNEPFFAGHFPDEPVMPAVLQIEAMAQVGGIFVLSFVPDPEKYSTYFLKVESARFKAKVVPGDTIVFILELITPLRRGLCHMKGKALVGEKIVMESELLAQVVKN
ncbi:MAG: bifunctional UDP-3-O-[3-hydroxymyristoyl] N-acetylglucosamine deacetylase/3-hydroxyacyl-ACP dehydratase [Bacteroidetes bacterium]|nr:bifunctional UDP-3-O-[3-hydroxymyristoyl] N-acetylglucosamine deacetylase/3-hydroxyacyl-ACP dehydratase [Bacteroidota bacterium]MBU1717699.1 bifunctional UDP-3-O-[3-hydroxymyristoyl] N-acetylglucosamine deacetylase/3-hydroxyacyl-ACP dehydratase [Bacteroidota bacterium]